MPLIEYSMICNQPALPRYPPPKSSSSGGGLTFGCAENRASEGNLRFLNPSQLR